MLRYAMTLGFGPIQGTEVVSRLCHHPDIIWAEAHYLPFVDHSFDVVSMFDVMEHLIPGDDEAACRELDRVARHHVLLTANDQHSTMGGGEELHINLRSHTEWDVLFRRWFHGCVTWLGGDQSYPAQRWRIDYA
jgi:ubiquinone/menaquinone biosynthesis C-methylase UbiE